MTDSNNSALKLELYQHHGSHKMRGSFESEGNLIYFHDFLIETGLFA